MSAIHSHLDRAFVRIQRFSRKRYGTPLIEEVARYAAQLVVIENFPLTEAVSEAVSALSGAEVWDKARVRPRKRGEASDETCDATSALSPAS